MSFTIVSWPSRLLTAGWMGCATLLAVIYATSEEAISGAIFRVPFIPVALVLGYMTLRSFWVGAVVSPGSIRYTGFLRTQEFTHLPAELKQVDGMFHRGVFIVVQTPKGRKSLRGTAVYQGGIEQLIHALSVYNFQGEQSAASPLWRSSINPQEALQNGPHDALIVQPITRSSPAQQAPQPVLRAERYELLPDETVDRKLR